MTPIYHSRTAGTLATTTAMKIFTTAGSKGKKMMSKNYGLLPKLKTNNLSLLIMKMAFRLVNFQSRRNSNI